MRNITIRTRLMLILLFVSLLACLVLSFIASNYGKKVISNEITNQLKVERIAKKTQIETYLHDVGNFVEVMGQNPTIIQATSEFKSAFYGLENEELNTECTKALADHYNLYMDKLAENLDVKKDISLFYPKSVQGCYLQYEYIVENPNEMGAKDKLVNAEDGSEYSKIHEKYHSFFNQMIKKYDFYDIFLVDLQTGDIVYTAYKETDFATNLYAGPYRNSNLAELARNLRMNNDIQTATWMDFAAYRPSYGAPAGFVGVPLTKEGETIGALIFQLPVNEINKIMTGNQSWEANGLRQSGETYLVGEDLYMRSISRFYLQDTTGYRNALLKIGESNEDVDKMYRFGTTILQQKINTQGVQEAFEGKTDTKIIQDYRNVNVISSYAPLDLEGLNWAVLAEIDEAEAFTPVGDFNKRLLTTTTVLVLLVTLLALILSGRFVKPIEKLTEASRKIIKGDTSHRVDINSKDEFGELGSSFNQMIEELDTQKTQLAEQSEENRKLLLNFIPQEFVKRLKNGERAFADEYQNVSLVVIDIVGFSQLTQNVGAHESVQMLNAIVEALDDSATNNHVERLRTVGDSYFAACGLFEPRLDHVKRVLQFAKEARQLIDQINLNNQIELGIQASIHTGSVIAGVVGTERFSFDVWGNLVSELFHINELEQENEILVSKEIVERIDDSYSFVDSGFKVKNDKVVYKLIDNTSV
ncbi:adenylate/guanylate cyclase domain-containing protein [Maribacter sp. 2308TA10-17]|uniref:adenylate/guanylate cyclase domain-containing protein n=1 Tax=Maribacter sp. 2308TA10-17 TaxID=3386276 RepID=UPI0039BC7918